MTNGSGAARPGQSDRGQSESKSCPLACAVNWPQLRLLTAILLAVLGGFIGIYLMVRGESFMELPADFIELAATQQETFLQTMVTRGLQPYCTGFGLLLLLAGIAYLMLGYNDRTHTDVKSPTPEDED